MIADRNKTELTRALTAAVVRYLDERGFKPVETEVQVCDGWIADIAGVISPTQTELQELKLIPRAPSWRNGGREKWNEVAKAAQKLMTCLVEVKTSMSDFRNDRKWTWLEKQFPVNLPYIAIPSTLPIERSQFPLSWGVLEYNEKNDTVRIVQIPEVWRMTVEQQLSVILEIAIRRDHHTRYERIRGFRREMVVAHNADISRTRMQDAIGAVYSIVRGRYESVENCLNYYRIKNLHEHDLELLRRLWATNLETK